MQSNRLFDDRIVQDVQKQAGIPQGRIHSFEFAERAVYQVPQVVADDVLVLADGRVEIFENHARVCKMFVDNRYRKIIRTVVTIARYLRLQ